MWTLICVLVFAVSLCAPAQTTPPARNPDWAVLVDGKMNLYRVTPTLYRAAQFRPADIAELEKLGIHTSINLRKFHSDKGELKGTSIQPIHLGTETWDIGDKTVIAALTAIRRAEMTGPVVVHCQHGADRTGLVMAMYRVVYQGWTKDAAMDELLHGGYGYHPVWKNITRYLRNVDVEKIRRAVDERLSNPR